MSGSPVLDHVWIIGPGRLGIAMAAALSRSGRTGRLTLTGRSATPPDHPIFPSRAAFYLPMGSLPARPPTLVLLSVPDRAIADVASDLARLDLPRAPVLHTSGVLESGTALAALAERGYPVGSVHPLAAITRSTSTGDELRDGWFGIEGDPEGLAAAEQVVRALRGNALRIRAGAKPLYHAAAVFASNYIVALLGIAEELMGRADIGSDLARPALSALAAGAVANVQRSGPVHALTGPVSRGDADTLIEHLRGLSADERPLYSLLARKALSLAEQQGVDAAAAARIASILEREAR